MRPESRECMFSALQWEEMMQCLRTNPVTSKEDVYAVGERLAVAIGWRKYRLNMPITLQVMHAVGQQFTCPVHHEDPRDTADM